MIFITKAWNLKFIPFLVLSSMIQWHRTVVSDGLNVAKTSLLQWGFRQYLPFSLTTLGGKHCRHPIVVMGVVDMFGHGHQCAIVNFNHTINSDQTMTWYAARNSNGLSFKTILWNCKFMKFIMQLHKTFAPLCSRVRRNRKLDNNLTSHIISYVLDWRFFSGLLAKLRIFWIWNGETFVKKTVRIAIWHV